MRSQDFLNEDWQKANKSDKTDGMSQKAVNAYRRENPGSKLKTAVTTPPSKLKKGSKDSKRRKSFCARSNGQKKMHNIDCSKTPDKAICAARRRWNCEEDIEQLEQALAEATFGTEPKRSARLGSRPARGHNAEPRYKSAPVVPGGDNPDAVHVPNKGDEPVQRGDQVVVQDPDNIATVFTGTVKRVGREHVYVTLKNGETIAAPHDEVSKSYEVLSKRAHRILDKKGKHVGNYKVSEECAGVGIVTKQNSTADVGPGTIKKNLKAFKLAQESHDDDDYVQQLTNEFVRRAKLGRRYVPAETILGLLDHFFKKFAINDRYFDDVYHRAVRTTDHEVGILEMEASLEEWKASRQLCRSSTPDSELGASALASCKSQGLRARDGNKSHKLGKSPKSRMKMGGHRIKGKKYGGPIPDWS